MYRSHVLVCGGTGCTSSGSHRIIEKLEKEIAAQGLSEEVGVVQTGCFGLCALGNPPGDRCFCFPWGRCCNLRDCRADAYCDCGGMDFLVYHFAQIKIRSTDQDRSLL